MKNILFNASTNVVGGGIKNSALFIKESLKNNDFKWHYAISSEVNNLLSEFGIKTHGENFTIFKTSPAKSSKAKKKILALVIEKKIDLVYTMAGPAYVKFPCTHLQGLSNAYLTHATWSAYKLKGTVYGILRYYVYTFIQFTYSLRADHFIFQTEFAKNSFKKKSGIEDSRLHVVSNAFDSSIKKHFPITFEFEKIQNKSKPVKIFCPGAAYLHKGFQFIPSIIGELKKISKRNFKFIMTMPGDSKMWNEMKIQLTSENLIEYCDNIGPYKYTQLISLLKESDIVFVPSLLETFSASYLEAMCAKKRLIVADKPFAREVCLDYATYINAEEALKTATILNDAFSELKLSKQQMDLADKILSKYGNQTERYQKIINLVHEVSLEQK